MASRSDLPEFNRRKLLGMMGMGGAVGIAGCIGDDDDEVTPTPTPTPDPGEIVEGGTLRVAMPENIDSFDIPWAADTTSVEALALLHDSLLTTDTQGTVRPWMARTFEIVETNDVGVEDYVDYMIPQEDAEEAGDQMIFTLQTDDLTMTRETGAEAVADGLFAMQLQFEIHEGIEFHNGEEVTSENFMMMHDRLTHSNRDHQIFDTMLHADAPDDYTLNRYITLPDSEAIRVPFTSPLPSAHEDIPDAGLDPREGVEPIGTGAYEFAEFEDASFFISERTDNYWLDDLGLEALEWYEGDPDFPTGPVIDTIDMSLIPSDPVRGAALLNDEVDYTFGLSLDTLDDFEASDDFVVEWTQAGGYTFLQFPMRVEPWDSERLRNGVNHLINREIVAGDIYAGWETPAWTPVPVPARGLGTEDYQALEEELRPRNEFNPDLAIELIEEVIDERDLDVPIEVAVETNADNDERVAMAELIAETMNGTGLFDVTVQLHEWLAYLARILTTEYAARGHMMIVGLSGSFNPGSFCAANHHSRNWGGCCNINDTSWDDLDQMIDDAQFGTDVVNDPEGERPGRYDEIWDVITDRDGTVYTTISISEAVHHERVRGVRAYPFSGSVLPFSLHSPDEEVVTWIDPDR